MFKRSLIATLLATWFQFCTADETPEYTPKTVLAGVNPQDILVNAPVQTYKSTLEESDKLVFLVINNLFDKNGNEN